MKEPSPDLLCVRSSAVAPCEERLKKPAQIKGKPFIVESHTCLRCHHRIAKPISRTPNPARTEDILLQALLRIAEWPRGANELWAKKIAGDALAAVMNLQDMKAANA